MQATHKSTTPRKHQKIGKERNKTMKHAKNLASLLLALVMVFAVATTAFAAGNGTITVNNTVSGADYTIYR